jgi:hypothetical protein
MAGSYKHVVDSNGEFRGVDLIDNLGDAYEALEEMYDMIQYLSRGDKHAIYEAWRIGHVAKRLPDRLTEEPELFTYERFWSE